MDDNIEQRAEAKLDIKRWPGPIDLRRLAETQPQSPSFIIEKIVPAGHGTLVSAHGGLGKSQLMLRQAVALALGGRTWAGLEVAPRRVLYLSCEDRVDVLHWRLSRIARADGIELGELAGRLHLIDAVGHDCVLWSRGTFGQPSGPTAALAELADVINRYETEVLYVDGVSDTYADNENDRAAVKGYVNALVGLVPPETGAVVLVAHVNRATALAPTTTEGFSGTTQWHNAVRSRLYLRRERDEDGGDGDGLVLEHQKSNYGPLAGLIRFEWDPVAELYQGRLEAAVTTSPLRDAADRRALMECIAAVTATGAYVPAASQGPRTALHVLRAQRQFPQSMLGGRGGARRFWNQLEVLRADGQVVAVPLVTPGRRRIEALVPGPGRQP